MESRSESARVLGRRYCSADHSATVGKCTGCKRAITRTERVGRSGRVGRASPNRARDRPGSLVAGPASDRGGVRCGDQAGHRSGSASGSPGDPRGRPVVRSHRGRERVRLERRPGPLRTVGAGPTRFTFDGRGEFNLATLRAGVSVDQLRKSLSNPALREGARPGLPRSYGGTGEGGHRRPAAQHDIRGGRDRGP